jgi:hypothetical protein
MLSTAAEIDFVEPIEMEEGIQFINNANIVMDGGRRKRTRKSNRTRQFKKSMRTRQFKKSMRTRQFKKSNRTNRTKRT